MDEKGAVVGGSRTPLSPRRTIRRTARLVPVSRRRHRNDASAISANTVFSYNATRRRRVPGKFDARAPNTPQVLWVWVEYRANDVMPVLYIYIYKHDS